MKSYGEYAKTKDYFLKAIPGADQYAGAKSYVFADGPARGLRGIDVHTGTGFSFTVIPDRGMDIAYTSYKGIPIAFLTKNGLKSPANCPPLPDAEFNRYFMAGLVTTCGPDNAGFACTINGKSYPMHGSNTMMAADDVAIEKTIDGCDITITVKGTLRYSELFSQNIVIQRSILAKSGESKVILEDKIMNEGGVPFGYMMMYHCNFGFPIVSTDSYIATNHKEMNYLFDPPAGVSGLDTTIEAPRADYEGIVFDLHEADGNVGRAGIFNRVLDLGAYVESNVDELKEYTLWMNYGIQDYVIGLEPGTNNPIGRENATREGRLTELLPGETHTKTLTIGVVEGEKEFTSLGFGDTLSASSL
ncbi:DUF4432 domain-containing protein [Clostridia bacterium]|nr:DUF4432 domain-containing protein [Clostridia bacterium]